MTVVFVPSNSVIVFGSVTDVKPVFSRNALLPSDVTLYVLPCQPTEDAIFNALAAYRSVPYDSYEQQLKQKIETDSDYVSVTMAVIGEIAVSGAPQDGVFHRRATVQVKAYDVLSQKVIATSEDAFEFQHKDPKAADKMLLDKAAVTSARAIADQTATYWQKR